VRRIENNFVLLQPTTTFKTTNDMKIAEIQALLEQKFKGERKDGLKLLALHIVMTAGEDDEKAKQAVEALTEDGVKAFIKDWRKDADAEITRSNQTAEQNLRNKYDFVEKGQPTPPTPPDPNPDPKGGITAEQLKAAIAEAIKPYTDKVAALEGANINATRKEQVEALFKDKNVNTAFKKAVMAGFEAKQFDSDEAFNSYLEETKGDIDSCVQELADQGLSGGAGSPLFGKTNKDGVSTEVQAYIEDRANAEKGESPLGGKKV
jgi:hypothetical protein